MTDVSSPDDAATLAAGPRTASAGSTGHHDSDSLVLPPITPHRTRRQESTGAPSSVAPVTAPPSSGAHATKPAKQASGAAPAASAAAKPKPNSTAPSAAGKKPAPASMQAASGTRAPATQAARKGPPPTTSRHVAPVSSAATGGKKAVAASASAASPIRGVGKPAQRGTQAALSRSGSGADADGDVTGADTATDATATAPDATSSTGDAETAAIGADQLTDGVASVPAPAAPAVVGSVGAMFMRPVTAQPTGATDVASSNSSTSGAAVRRDSVPGAPLPLPSSIRAAAAPAQTASAPAQAAPAPVQATVAPALAQNLPVRAPVAFVPPASGLGSAPDSTGDGPAPSPASRAPSTGPALPAGPGASVGASSAPRSDGSTALSLGSRSGSSVGGVLPTRLELRASGAGSGIGSPVLGSPAATSASSSSYSSVASAAGGPMSPTPPSVGRRSSVSHIISPTAGALAATAAPAQSQAPSATTSSISSAAAGPAAPAGAAQYPHHSRQPSFLASPSVFASAAATNDVALKTHSETGYYERLTEERERRIALQGEVMTLRQAVVEAEKVRDTALDKQREAEALAATVETRLEQEREKLRREADEHRAALVAELSNKARVDDDRRARIADSQLAEQRRQWEAEAVDRASARHKEELDAMKRMHGDVVSALRDRVLELEQVVALQKKDIRRLGVDLDTVTMSREQYARKAQLYFVDHANRSRWRKLLLFMASKVFLVRSRAFMRFRKLHKQVYEVLAATLSGQTQPLAHLLPSASLSASATTLSSHSAAASQSPAAPAAASSMSAFAPVPTTHVEPTPPTPRPLMSRRVTAIIPLKETFGYGLTDSASASVAAAAAAAVAEREDPLLSAALDASTEPFGRPPQQQQPQHRPAFASVPAAAGSAPPGATASVGSVSPETAMRRRSSGLTSRDLAAVEEASAEATMSDGSATDADNDLDSARAPPSATGGRLQVLAPRAPGELASLLAEGRPGAAPTHGAGSAPSLATSIPASSLPPTVSTASGFARGGRPAGHVSTGSLSGGSSLSSASLGHIVPQSEGELWLERAREVLAKEEAFRDRVWQCKRRGVNLSSLRDEQISVIKDVDDDAIWRHVAEATAVLASEIHACRIRESVWRATAATELASAASLQETRALQKQVQQLQEELTRERARRRRHDGAAPGYAQPLSSHRSASSTHVSAAPAPQHAAIAHQSSSTAGAAAASALTAAISGLTSPSSYAGSATPAAPLQPQPRAGPASGSLRRAAPAPTSAVTSSPPQASAAAAARGGRLVTVGRQARARSRSNSRSQSPEPAPASQTSGSFSAGASAARTPARGGSASPDKLCSPPPQSSPPPAVLAPLQAHPQSHSSEAEQQPQPARPQLPPQYLSLFRAQLRPVAPGALGNNAPASPAPASTAESQTMTQSPSRRAAAADKLLSHMNTGTGVSAGTGTAAPGLQSQPQVPQQHARQVAPTGRSFK